MTRLTDADLRIIEETNGRYTAFQTAEKIAELVAECRQRGGERDGLRKAVEAHAKWAEQIPEYIGLGDADQVVTPQQIIDRLAVLRELAAKNQTELAAMTARAEKAERELAEAREEIEFLRRYGNKDCTWQADEARHKARQERAG